MAPDKAGRVIFIGNIPYGLTEQQIIDIFSSVGQVLSFRLVYDKDSGRPKGFGFAEFSDADAAASAVRNLNDHDIMGRKLRVDYSNDGGANDSAPTGYSSQAHQPTSGQDLSQQRPGGLPVLPAGTPLEPGLTAPDQISRTLATLPAPQLLDIISQMKGLVMSDPAKATELLKQAPQLSYAIFQSLLLLGLVDHSVLVSVVDQAHQPQQAPPPPQPSAYGQYPQYMQQPNSQTTPLPNPPYQPPPPPQANLDPARADLLRQVLAMTPQQLDALPPHERGQLMAIRQQLMGGQGF